MFDMFELGPLWLSIFGRQDNLCLWTQGALRSSRRRCLSTASAFAEATVKIEGNQFAVKATQSPRTTRSRLSIILTSAWLGLLHCKYRILLRQSSIESSQSRNGQAPKGMLHSRRLNNSKRELSKRSSAS